MTSVVEVNIDLRVVDDVEVVNPDLVIAQCKAGIVGSFPSLNARPIEQLEEWLQRIKARPAFDKAINL